MNAGGRVAPVVTGLSPKEGMPGTQVTIRGENLGSDPNDLIALIICGTDCLVSAKWKSPSKIVARVGQAKRGAGDIVIVTRSGGRGISNVQFRVFIEQVGPLADSSVWVDETRTVPCRGNVRNVPDLDEGSVDALGLKSSGPKADYNELSKVFPNASGNLRMNNFNSGWYLLENHRNTNFHDLQRGLLHLKKEIAKEKQATKEVHRSNLYSLINCVDALNKLFMQIETDADKYRWPLTMDASKLIDLAKKTSESLFTDVLSRKDRADVTRNALTVLSRFRFVFFLKEAIDENMRQGDYAAILNDYARASALYKDSDVLLFKEVMKVLNNRILEFKQTIRKNLTDTPASFEEQNRLIKYLKILEPSSNPAWDCITAYHCWLENCLWELQDKYHAMAVEESKNQLELVMDSGKNFVQTFITEMLSLLTDKLMSFWKLAQSYSDASDEKYLEQQDDINQMMINTVNASSWLMFNALIPKSLPPTVSEQYKNQFVEWPSVTEDKSAQLSQLLFALKSLRDAVKFFLESQFSKPHVHPLVELCKSIRLRSIELITTKTAESVMALSAREDWKVDLSSTSVRTILPDLFETQMNEILPAVKQTLAVGGYPGEEDLFAKESVRQLIVDRFIVVIGSVRDLYEQLFQFKSKRPRPLNLSINESDGVSLNSSLDERPRSTNPAEPSSRRLLVSVCNVEYMLNHSLPIVCKRLSDNGVKYGDLILEKCKLEYAEFRRELLKRYRKLKAAPFLALIDSANYSRPSELRDVSPYIKELVMGMVLIKAELHLLLPQLVTQVLQSAVEFTLQRLLGVVGAATIADESAATQLIADLTAVEEALRPFVTAQLRSSFNAVRAESISRLDREAFHDLISQFRKSMRMSVEDLAESGAPLDVISTANDQDTSNV